MAGEWDLSKIERGMTAKRFLEWEAYGPFGALRADHRAALIAGMIFNMAVDVKDRKPYTEWLLKFKDTEVIKKGQSIDEKVAIAYAITMAYAKPKDAVDSETKAKAMADAFMKAQTR